MTRTTITDATLSREAIWGAKNIANFMGASVEIVYDLADDPDAPFYKPGGRYFAIKSEIWHWLRQKAPK